MLSLGNVIIKKVQTMSDGGLQITLVTREQSPEGMSDIFTNLNKEVPDIQFSKIEEDIKSPSQRLKAVLFRLWEQENKDSTFTAEHHYRDRMELLINQIKEKLN